MRVVTNRQQIKRSRTIAQILFVVSIVILFGGLVLTNTVGRANDVLLFVPCLVMPIGLLTTLISVRLTNQYVRLPHPEDAIKEGLKGINRRSVLYNYVLMPKHVLLSPQGIYSFTTRFQETRFKVEGERWTNPKARGPLGPLFLFLKQENLGDPFKQARKEAASVQAIVDDTLPDSGIVVQPVVVFTGLKTVLEVEDPAIPVVYADSKKKPSLKGVLREEKRKEEPPAKNEKAKAGKIKEETPPGGLTPEQMDALHDAFMSGVTTVGGQTDNDEG